MQSFSGESLFLILCHISLIKLGTEVSEAELFSVSSLLPVHLGSSGYQWTLLGGLWIPDCCSLVLWVDWKLSRIHCHLSCQVAREPLSWDLCSAIFTAVKTLAWFDQLLFLFEVLICLPFFPNGLYIFSVWQRTWSKTINLIIMLAPDTSVSVQTPGVSEQR